MPDAVHAESPVAAADAPDVTEPPSAANVTAVEATEEVAAPAEVTRSLGEPAPESTPAGEPEAISEPEPDTQAGTPSESEPAEGGR